MSTIPNRHGAPLRAFLFVFFKITVFGASRGCIVDTSISSYCCYIGLARFRLESLTRTLLKGGLLDVSPIRSRLSFLLLSNSHRVSGSSLTSPLSRLFPRITTPVELLFSLVPQSVETTVNIHALWICLGRFLLLAQF
jgi:hypothetical protein